jgi:hypothetical protein
VVNEVLQRVKEERNILPTIRRMKANWSSHILGKNGLLKHDTEGDVECTGRRETRRKQLFMTLKKIEDTRI